MELTESAKREKEFHENRFKDGKGKRGFVNKAYIAFEYAFKRREMLIKVSNERVLEIGCGIGINRAKSYKKRGCSYTGVDISDNAIKKNKKLAGKAELNVEYIVDDANTLSSIKGEKFDLIIMSGVLHHLDYDLVIPTLESLLEKNGKIIMLEPMGTNPFINLFRKFTPNLRTKDEHPLHFKDLIYIKKVFPKSKFELHSIVSLGMIPLTLIFSKKFLLKLSRPLGKLDLLLAKIPIIKRFSWLVLIDARF